MRRNFFPLSLGLEKVNPGRERATGLQVEMKRSKANLPGGSGPGPAESGNPGGA